MTIQTTTSSGGLSQKPVQQPHNKKTQIVYSRKVLYSTEARPVHSQQTKQMNGFRQTLKQIFTECSDVEP